MAEMEGKMNFDSPSSNLEKSKKFKETFDLKHVEDFCSKTTAPKNCASCMPGNDASVILVDNLTPELSQVDVVIRKCFIDSRNKVTNDDGYTDSMHIRQHDNHLHENEVWWTITKNFGNVLPVDWFSTYARQLQERSLQIKQEETSEATELDLSDDEDLQQAFDVHSLIISSLHQEPMFTADEVISEIEGMLDESPPPSGISTDLEIFSSELLKFRERSLALGKSLENNLDNHSVKSLCELYDELDCTVREYSEVLIQQLALREELEYEKELKNQFISLLINIQKKKRDLQLDQKPRTTNSTDGTTNSISSLTTLIPYYPSGRPPTTELLEIYVKILRAMDTESATLPILLTDYILKVVCPTN